MNRQLGQKPIARKQGATLKHSINPKHPIAMKKSKFF